MFASVRYKTRQFHGVLQRNWQTLRMLWLIYSLFPRRSRTARRRDVRSPQRIERWIIVEKFINVSWQYPFERFSNKQELEIRFQHLFRFILGIISQKLKVAWIVNPDIRFRRIELHHDFLPLSTTYFWDVTVEGLELLVDYDLNKFFSINCFVYPFSPFVKVPQICFSFQVHNFNAVGAAGLETERTKRYSFTRCSFMVLAYLIVSASFSSVASCSFNNLENYKERETKTIGRPPSVLFWYWNLSINLSALQTKYRWTFSLKNLIVNVSMKV